MDHHHHFGYNTKLTPKKNKNCFIVAKKLQHKWVSLFGGKWVGMVASHNNGVLSYHHSLNPQSPPPQPLLSLAIVYLGSNPMALISIGPRYKGYLCGDDPPTMF